MAMQAARRRHTPIASAMSTGISDVFWCRRVGRLRHGITMQLTLTQIASLHPELVTVGPPQEYTLSNKKKGFDIEHVEHDIIIAEQT
ncbi:hypothetical protein EVAR_34454_1 [Eumeta japonica]|uniref:Uncharacterized protein n=1 Tax=Eumeta variegata TaxID=151549 RepID=A0A4C1WJH4_EUMVA|nr:hypothetical protein EVAR_34454_1 [Eumeta japonica]